MHPLKIAFLWHKHQPDYKIGGEFILPWTRMHGVKDYFDIPETLHEFPSIRQTINIVPSMMMQIKEYVSGKVEDKIQKLTKIPAKSLSATDKTAILKYFFLCNEDNMIKPYPRYLELFEKTINSDESFSSFNSQDWLDLQVWYNLTWFGPYSRLNGFIARLFAKGRNFSEAEKLLVLKEHIIVLDKIAEGLTRLSDLNQIEVSVSPMYHPILPLLFNSKSALEAMPDCVMPDPVFSWPEDAKVQFELALKYLEDNIGRKALGMWPSEGSVSNETLEMFINAGLAWTATDEEILKASLPKDAPGTEKFFPHKYRTKSGSIGMLFRDHFLSDRIGFVYSAWNADDAAKDLVANFKKIRAEIIRVHGEDALEHACVSIILDGENCWEFYKDNGLPFLRALYSLISHDTQLKTVLCSEATDPKHLDYRPELTSIRAGSWINSNFDIWIGHEEDQRAWSFLGNARQAVEDAKKSLDKSIIDKAMEQVYIVEGSDSFWWYGPEHSAPNKSDFDFMFREHIRNIYNILELTPPEELNFPISTKLYQQKAIVPPTSEINPPFDGSDSPQAWDYAGVFSVEGIMSAMHSVGGNLSQLLFGYGDGKVFFKVVFSKGLDETDSIEIIISSPFEANLKISKFGVTLEKSGSEIHSSGFTLRQATEIFLGTGVIPAEKLADFKFKVVSTGSFGEMAWPRSGEFSTRLI